MTTITYPWSLGSCSNKSLNHVEPPVPPLTASDPQHSLISGPIAPTHPAQRPPQIPRFQTADTSLSALDSVRFSRFSHISRAHKILCKPLSSSYYHSKISSALFEKSCRNVRKASHFAQLSRLQQFTTVRGAVRSSTFSHVSHLVSDLRVPQEARHQTLGTLDPVRTFSLRKTYRTRTARPTRLPFLRSDLPHFPNVSFNAASRSAGGLPVWSDDIPSRAIRSWSAIRSRAEFRARAVATPSSAAIPTPAHARSAAACCATR